MNEDTKPIRRGEELNLENLREFLQANLPELQGEIEVSQFSAGSSNLTYCVKIGAEEFVLRRPPFGNQVKSAHDMKREFRVLSKLSAVYAPAPKPLIFCEDEAVIGAEFYLMERRRGLVLRQKLPESLEKTSENARRICESFIENLAALHALDYEKAGLGDFGKPTGYTRRQIEGWTKRYFNAKTDEHAELETAIEWLNANIPATESASLIHNDYKFDNLMVAPEDLTKIVAVFDWEMATIGEPLMDFGTTLGYWCDPDAPQELLYGGFNPPFLVTQISRRDLTEIYAEKSGRDVSNVHFYYVFGLFKIAVIVQQIYARYKKGFTQDERFANFNYIVGLLGKNAFQAIEKGEI